MTVIKQIIRTKLILPALLITVVLSSCDRGGSGESGISTTGTTSSDQFLDETDSGTDPAIDTPTRELVASYLHLSELELSNSISLAIDLNDAISAFLLSPTLPSMDRVKNSWLLSHRKYQESVLHRHLVKGLASDEQNSLLSLRMDQLDYQLNHWPILPGYVDYIEDYPDSGVVSDINISIDQESIRDQHGYFDLAEATTGFHVLEFLIWGENSSNTNPRPISDYEEKFELTAVDLEIGLEISEISSNRRRLLLPLVAQVLSNDLQELQNLLESNKSMLESRLEKMSKAVILDLLSTAITNLIADELLVKSLYPLLNNDIEGGTQSPYSHSTHNAVLAQLVGIEQLLRDVTNENGNTLEEILAATSDNLVASFYSNFDASKECLTLLYAAPQQVNEPDAVVSTEFKTVECINFLNNMQNSLENILL
jgi:putative iron-regulated protein